MAAHVHLVCPGNTSSLQAQICAQFVHYRPILRLQTPPSIRVNRARHIRVHPQGVTSVPIVRAMLGPRGRMERRAHSVFLALTKCRPVRRQQFVTSALRANIPRWWVLLSRQLVRYVLFRNRIRYRVAVD